MEVDTERSSFTSKMKMKLRRASGKTKLTTIKTKENKKPIFCDIANNQNARPIQRVKSLKTLPEGSKNVRPSVKKVKAVAQDKTHEDLDLCQLKTEIERLNELRVPVGVTDIDKDEKDYFLEPTYAQDVMEYLRVQEQLHLVPRNYLDGKSVTASMRCVLVDWLLQVQDHLDMQQETLHLCVALINQCLNKANFDVGSLQLVGTTCLFIAAKFNERFAPDVDDLVRLTDNTYKYADVLEMELTILHLLDFDLSMPTACVFLNRFLKLVDFDKQLEQMCRYLIDLSLTDSLMVLVPPSKLAAAALALSRGLVTVDIDWTRTCAYYTGYINMELVSTQRRLLMMLKRQPQSTQQGAYKKYSSRSKHGGIAKSQVFTSESNVLRYQAELEYERPAPFTETETGGRKENISERTRLQRNGAVVGGCSM